MAADKITAQQRAAGIKSWHEAGSDEVKLKAALKEFPFLAECYSMAAVYVEKPTEVIPVS